MICPLKEAAKDAGHAPALIESTKVWSFKELDAMADRAAAVLEQMGIQPLDRVALRHAPSAEWIALFFALLRLQATLFPIHLRLPSSAVEALFARVQPQYCFDSSHIPQLFHSSRHSTQESVNPNIAALYLMTSGSSGVPKIAMLSLRNLLSSALAANTLVQLRPGDVWLLSLPLYHVGGIGVVMRALSARATILLDPAQQKCATHISYVPTQLYRLQESRFPHLRTLLIGGAPLSESLYQTYRHLPLIVSYGLTEMSSLVAATSTPIWQDGHCFLGSPLPGQEIRMDAEQEIWVRGATRFLGYWNQKTPFDPKGWFPTNDLGHIDPERGLALKGRKDWQFISGGEKIQPEEIEQLLYQCPHIEEAIVRPRADAEFGHRPILFARSKDPSWDLEAMKNQLKLLLPAYKIPVALYFLEPSAGDLLKRNRTVLNDPQIIDNK